MSKQNKMVKKAAVARQVTSRRNDERKQAAKQGITYKEFKHNRRKKEKKEERVN